MMSTAEKEVREKIEALKKRKREYEALHGQLEAVAAAAREVRKTAIVTAYYGKEADHTVSVPAWAWEALVDTLDALDKEEYDSAE